jgi:hypothetical protein
VKEQAAFDCVQQKANEHMRLEEERAGGPWGYVQRAIWAGAYASKLRLRDCQWKLALEAVEICANDQHRATNQPAKESPPAAEKKKPTKPQDAQRK